MFFWAGSESSAGVGSGGGAAATVCPVDVAGCGVRSDSRATTIVIAAASTARPASCPPISLGSIGDEDASVTALVPPRFLVPCPGPDDVDGELELGPTVGNRLEMLPGVIVVSGTPGFVTGGIVTGGSVPVGGGDELDWPRTVATDASAGESAPPVSASPWTLMVTPICSPEVAFFPILLVTISSNC